MAVSRAARASQGAQVRKTQINPQAEHSITAMHRILTGSSAATSFSFMITRYPVLTVIALQRGPTPLPHWRLLNELTREEGVAVCPQSIEHSWKSISLRPGAATGSKKSLVRYRTVSLLA